MIKVLTQASKLAEEILKSDIYKDYKKAEFNFMTDTLSLKRIKAVEMITADLEELKKNENDNKEAIILKSKALDIASEMLNSDENYIAYASSNKKFDEMMGHINNLIKTAITLQSDCTGNCSNCDSAEQ